MVMTTRAQPERKPWSRRRKIVVGAVGLIALCLILNMDLTTEDYDAIMIDCVRRGDNDPGLAAACGRAAEAAGARLRRGQDPHWQKPAWLQ
jgi:hypothetical protein